MTPSNNQLFLPGCFTKDFTLRNQVNLSLNGLGSLGKGDWSWDTSDLISAPNLDDPIQSFANDSYLNPQTQRRTTPATKNAQHAQNRGLFVAKPLDSSDCFRPPQVSPDSSVSLFFILATQPSIGFTTFIAPHLRQAFDDLVATSCHAAAHAAEQTRVWVELWEDATEEELIDLVEEPRPGFVGLPFVGQLEGRIHGKAPVDSIRPLR